MTDTRTIRASYVKQISAKLPGGSGGASPLRLPLKGPILSPHVGRGNWEAWVPDPTIPLPGCVWSWTSSTLSVLSPLTQKMQRRCVPFRPVILQGFLPALSGAWLSLGAPHLALIAGKDWAFPLPDKVTGWYCIWCCRWDDRLCLPKSTLWFGRNFRRSKHWKRQIRSQR